MINAYYKTGDDLQPTDTYISSDSSYNYGFTIIYNYNNSNTGCSISERVKYIHPVNLLYASFNFIRFKGWVRKALNKSYFIRQPTSDRRNKMKMNFQRLLKKYCKRIKEAV